MELNLAEEKNEYLQDGIGVQDISTNNATSTSKTNATETSTIKQDKFMELDKRISSIHKKIKKFEKVLTQKSTKYTEILGIFVALFTFISVNIQIFSKVSTLNDAMVFVILMFFCLIGFVMFLHVTLNHENKNNSVINFVILLILLLFAIGYFMSPNFTNKIKPIYLDSSASSIEMEKRIYGVEQKLDGYIQGNR